MSYNITKNRVGSEEQYDPRNTGTSLFPNTDLCVDVKTKLRNDPIAEVGKSYQGVLTHDKVDHYTFVETLSTTGKRNPHVFIGKYITVTRRDDGSLRLNFRPVTMGADFNIYRYATGVFSELIRALIGLVGKEVTK